MATRKTLVLHKFEGERFADGGLDLDVLPDLVAYKSLLVETAMELWRQKHPQRERLPRNFEQSLNLKFYELKHGSTVVPLVREVEYDEPAFPFAARRDELDDAVVLVAEAIDATAQGSPFPAGFPKSALAYFTDYGKALRPGESFVHDLLGNDLVEQRHSGVTTARYSTEVRSRLLQRLGSNYEDKIEIVGEVRATDLDGQNFTLRLDDGTKIFGKFTVEQESTVTEALREHASRRLRAKGLAEFTPDGKARRFVSVQEIALELPGEIRFIVSARPAWELAVQLGAGISPDEWAKVPSDLSRNLDHYLYGAPKEEE